MTPPKQLVFLDTNVWNALVDRTGGQLTPELLVGAYRAGRVEIIGTLPLEEEILATARTDPRKYERMRRLYNKLTGDRILLPLNLRHIREAEHGGALPAPARYVSKRMQKQLRAQATDRAAIADLGNQIHAQKETRYLRQTTSRDRVKSALSELPTKPSTEMRGFLKEFNPADWLEDVVREGVDAPAIAPINEISYSTLPSAWLITTYWSARAKRTQADNRKVQQSDTHDSEHCAAGAYFDILVTCDAEFRNTLSDIADLPLEVMTPDGFADAIHL